MPTSTTIDAAQLSAFVSFLRAHAEIVRRINQRMQAAGHITMEVYDILIALEDAENQRLTMSELADRSILSPSGITRLVDRLEKCGFVERKCNDTDRRSTFACLTPCGLSARKAAWPLHQELIVDFWSNHFTAEEAAKIKSQFDRILAQ